VAHEIAHSAVRQIKRKINEEALVRVVRFDERAAVGSGCGINLICRTTTGCVLGAGQICVPRSRPEEMGRYVHNNYFMNALDTSSAFSRCNILIGK